MRLRTTPKITSTTAKKSQPMDRRTAAVEEKGEGGDHADQDLDDESDRGAGVVEEVDLVAANEEVADLHHRVGAEEPAG